MLQTAQFLLLALTSLICAADAFTGTACLSTLPRSRQRPLRTPALKAAAPTDQSAAAEKPCTCRNCKEQFLRTRNGQRSCKFHPGIYTGRLNRVNDIDTSGLEYFWSCCGEYERKGVGCIVGPHESYDDTTAGWRSPLTGKLRS
ncbi:unnamed protein product [Phaeothamnion confervicola]